MADEEAQEVYYMFSVDRLGLVEKEGQRFISYGSFRGIISESELRSRGQLVMDEVLNNFPAATDPTWRPATKEEAEQIMSIQMQTEGITAGDIQSTLTKEQMEETLKKGMN